MFLSKYKQHLLTPCHSSFSYLPYMCEIAAGIAAVLGRKMVVKFDAFNRIFLPPLATEWDHGLHAAYSAKNKRYDMEKNQFDYEIHGRAPNRFGNWVKNMTNKVRKAKKDGKSLTTKTLAAPHYTKPVLNAGICGGDRDFILSGNCLSHVMPKFIECASQGSQGYMPEPLLSVPFFHTLFQRPGPILQKKLKVVRRRLGLPLLEPGLEPYPGAWGLYTPGYYIFAMHFRRVPLGFEPLSVELNTDANRKWRLSVLEDFWYTAQRYAERAKEIAACRGETLLIYFATDDVAHLRPKAKELFSKYGKVVFGLLESEVGHVSPHWNKQAEQEVIDRARELDAQKTLQIEGSSKSDKEMTSVEVDTTGEVHIGEMIHVEKYDPKVQENHGIMSLVEWWILANSQWLLSHSGTSFSDTAAGVGLGPRGKMERLDVIHGKMHSQTSRRRDWEGDSCSEVGAVDPEQALKCPNI